MTPDAEFAALVDDILRCARLKPVGTCAFIGPDLQMCGQPERSKGAALCSWHWAMTKAVRMAERMEP